MVRPASFCALLGFVLLARPAGAIEHPDTDDAWQTNYDPGKALRRSDFAMGLLVGGAAGNVLGYPNELLKIGDPKYEANTGFGVGPSGGLWLGGALRDWLVLGIGLSIGTVGGNGYSSSGQAFIFHIETYPLFGQGKIWQDLGLLAEFGAGGRNIVKGATTTAAEGGLMSLATFGVVYEPIRLGAHLSAGPLVEFTYQGSQSVTAAFATIGFRASFYGGPG
jgi:hypothetical protein